MLEILEILKPHATIISALSAFISAIAVVISTIFVIWTTFFRKTRRDRIDDLKEEMQELLDGRLILHASERASFLQSIDSKYKTPKYEELHNVAFTELISDGKLELRWGND